MTLQCNIEANNQSILSDIEITWVKEDGSPLPNRANLDQNGILIISNVQAEDSGTYICKATSAYFVVTDKATLNVGGGIIGTYDELKIFFFSCLFTTVRSQIYYLPR